MCDASAIDLVKARVAFEHYTPRVERCFPTPVLDQEIDSTLTNISSVLFPELYESGAVDNETQSEHEKQAHAPL